MSVFPLNPDFRGYNPWIGIQTVIRPSRLLSDAEKDEDYDNRCARYYISSQIASQVNNQRLQYYVNSAYAAGQRWGEDEDVKLFLGEGQDTTSRVALRLDVVQPMLTRIRGMADNLSTTPHVISSTRFAKRRKEDDLMRKVLMSQAAQAGPAMAAAYGQVGISPNEEQVMQQHDANWTDEFAKAVEMLIKGISDYNELDKQKKDIAKSIALSGIAAMHPSIQGTRVVWELCDPSEVGFDPSCIKGDLSDAEYVYTCPIMEVPNIAERWQPKRKQIEEIDRFPRLQAGSLGMTNWVQNKPRVFTVYWDDLQYVERGYVNDNGEVRYVTLNKKVKDPGLGDKVWTEADLVEVPDNDFTSTWTNQEIAERKQRRYASVVRYCSLIPWEYLPGGYTDRLPYNRRNELDPSKRTLVSSCGDLVLDRGIYKWQEADPDDTYKRGKPLKLSTWLLIAGNPIAPLSAAISPQRVANQVTSDLMWRLRQAGNKSVAIDTDAMAGSTMDQGDIFNALKEGNPVDLKGAIVGGLQNAVRDIDTSPGNSFYQMFSLLPQIKQFSEAATGLYEANFGAPQGQDQLVGAFQLQLQQAGVMQQPLNAAIASTIEQVHQWNAQAGRQFMINFPNVLSQLAGDMGAEVLIQAGNSQLEQFRVEVIMTSDMEKQRLIADMQTIPTLLQMGMLDPQTAAKLLGRATQYDAYREAEKFTAQMALAQQQQQEAAAMAQQQQNMAIEDAALREEENKLAEQEAKMGMESAKLQQKLMQPMAQAESEWLKPPQETQPTL
ncbi:MAG: hypothetical protein E6Q97_14045 [Desulfurellales bacterium]|nr:MAG: hypothetical protein E6Q97_14045 [Desulfurellales bacterium]